MTPDWTRCRWISAGGGESTPMPLFRRAFALGRPVKRALVFICGLGQFELRVNGRKAGDDVMEPPWTHYAKSCLYVTHDVTDLLRPGENAVGVLLGNGMYNVTGKRYKKFKGTFGPPKLIAELQIEHDDGTYAVICTDDAWRTAPGPITFSCIYGGEDHDARLEQPGWDAPEFDDSAWRAADVVGGPGGELVASIAPPVRVIRTYTPANVTEPAPGVKVFDLEQNISGWPAVSLTAPAGTTVTLVTGELLDDAGRVTQRNTGKPVSFSYTCRGEQSGESWHPRFSYTGFRYVEVADLALDISLTVAGDVVHASAEVVGRFECSHPLLNRIHQLILAAIRSNMQSILTDCPHREKLGWLEQTHLMGEAIFQNFDAAPFYAKICRDIRDAQRDDGCVPTIAPQYTSFEPPWDVFNDSPEWGSAVILSPWLAYRFTGDRAILDDNYGAMKRYVDYLETRQTPDGLIDYGLGDWYDIGPGDPGFSKLTSRSVTATGIYLHDLVILAAIARLLGRDDDHHRYLSASTRVRTAFNRHLYDASTSRYDTGSQTAHAMALFLGLAGDNQPAVLDHLIADIRSRGNHISAGDIGFYFVLRALADNGRSDVIFDLLTRTDPPSYGAMLARGATTLTEAWDANPKVSQNHLMLGHAEAWFHQYLAGIRVDLSRSPPQRIVIAPKPVGDVTWVNASYRSALGPISVQWERAGRSFVLTVDLPADAAVILPDGSRHIPGPGLHTLRCPLE